MASDLLVGVGAAVFSAVALSLLWSTDHRARLLFVPGVLVLVLGSAVLPAPLAGYVAAVGIVAGFASTVPLLRE